MRRSLQERLSALQQSVGVQESGTSGIVTEPVDSPVNQVTVAAQPLVALGFERCDDGFGEYWRRTLRYDVLTYHGASQFGHLFECSLASLARAGKVDSCEAPNLRFYDTETTGLGTGAGTIPFLHAVGQFEEDEFVVHQYFLHDYSEEAALLLSMTQNHFSNAECVVSFNGKSFDWPLYKSRMTMYRMQIPDCPHLDLLHPSRRLWKHRLPRVSLSSVESAILGMSRKDDLPGKEAPTRYFAYVESNDASLVHAVLEHNATDVCSLVVLTALLADVLAGQAAVDSATELVALGRLYDEWRQYDLAEHCFTSALTAPDADWRARWLGSLYHKRRGHWPEACELWVEMTSLHLWTVSPAVELAKYYEHHTRNLESALMWARLALQRVLTGVRQNHQQGPGPHGETEDVLVRAIRHRIARIQHKQSFKASGENGKQKNDDGIAQRGTRQEP
jgi:uncharacterized protein